MSSVLAFVVECGALAVLVGAGLSLAVWPLLLQVRAGRWERAALRAEAALLLGTVPALGVAVALLGAALPSLSALLTGASDHCGFHGHHLHLCFLHSSGLKPLLAAAGASALAVTVFRAASLWGRVAQERAQLERLERLGTPGPAGRFPVVLVPGGPLLCHAAGVFRRRIVISSSLAGSLSGDELESALAHERAHLTRGDPLARLLLAAAGLVALPWVARLASEAYRTAAEDACDAAACESAGDGTTVAHALVRVASLQKGALSSIPAFGEQALERRVRALLSGSAPGRVASGGLWVLGAGAVGALLGAFVHAGELHHALETFLFLLS